MNAKLKALVDISLSTPDEISLDEVCDDVKYDLGVEDDREVKRLTLEAEREMLRRGVLVAFDSDVASKQRLERTPDEIIAHIDNEGDTLGEAPSLPGEICVFLWTPSAMEAYARRQGLPPERS
ncbi:hypothetical protein SAMN02990966_00759 [Rhodospirillales bacterium URHD0017]|nr:hypothetical protein SAMN02990966_00759 [Rhodospirillales bacterium URHD0017]